MKKETITKQSHTDWQAIDQMKDEDIDFSDLPEISPEKFAHALVRKNLQPIQKKTQITLRVDTDVLNWFKDQGKGYQTRINALLKAYMEAHQGHH